MFDIDLVRYVLEKKVNDNRISFFSFYEPLNSLEQVVFISLLMKVILSSYK